MEGELVTSEQEEVKRSEGIWWTGHQCTGAWAEHVHLYLNRSFGFFHFFFFTECFQLTFSHFTEMM